MNRNVLYLVIGALVVATGVASYFLYQDRHQTTGLDISAGNAGVSIKTK